MRTGPGKRADKVKSPKAEKASGKKMTTWDPFIYGGPGATGEEAKNLERGPKSPKPGSAEGSAMEDLQVRVNPRQLDQNPDLVGCFCI